LRADDGEGAEEEEGGVEKGEFGDGVGFPKIKPWSVAIHLRTMTLELPEGFEPGAEERKTK